MRLLVSHLPKHQPPNSWHSRRLDRDAVVAGKTTVDAGNSFDGTFWWNCKPQQCCGLYRLQCRKGSSGSFLGCGTARDLHTRIPTRNSASAAVHMGGPRCRVFGIIPCARGSSPAQETVREISIYRCFSDDSLFYRYGALPKGDSSSRPRAEMARI